MSLASTSSQQTIYTLRGVLRMGFILRDSEIAKQVRNVALNIIEGVGQFLPQEVLEQLIQRNSPLQAFSDGANLKLSVPLFDHWGAIKISNLEKYYQTGGIPGLTAKSIRDRIMALAGRIDIDGWDFKAQQQIKYQLTSSRYKSNELKIPHDFENFDFKTRQFVGECKSVELQTLDVTKLSGAKYAKVNLKNVLA